MDGYEKIQKIDNEVDLKKKTSLFVFIIRAKRAIYQICIHQIKSRLSLENLDNYINSFEYGINIKSKTKIFILQDLSVLSSENQN